MRIACLIASDHPDRGLGAGTAERIPCTDGTGMGRRPGSVTTRTELARKYGGSAYSGGIVPSRTSPNIFLFSDPVEGEKYGYNYDGIDPSGRFNYTGAGSSGDHRLDGANGSVLGHAASGRSLRLYVAVGRLGDSQTKLQQYVGEFVVDPLTPYRFEPSVDTKNHTRAALVIRLLPVGENVLRMLLLSKDVRELDATGPAALLVATEVDSTYFYETKGTLPAQSEKRESQLVQAFAASLSNDPERFARWAIRVPGESGVLLTDIYDKATHTLYEAKGSAGRGIVRLAVGQLLDYRRHLEVPDLTTSVLLPAAPTDDVGKFVLSTGSALTFQQSDGTFAHAS